MDSYHRHDLRPSLDGKKTFRCSRCQQKDFGPRLACVNKPCGYVLHKDCAKAQLETLTHAFFPDCTFFFVKKCNLNRYCNACGRGVHGYFYHCFDQGLNLHPCCANLEHRRLVEPIKGDGSVLMNLYARELSECFFCGKKRLNSNTNTRSWTYVSEGGTCHFHVACLKKVSIKAVEERRRAKGR